MADEHPLVQLALEPIDLFVHEHRRLRRRAPPKSMSARAGAFVTLHTASTGQLRGCIGTIQPMEDSIVEEVINNAISATTQDPRFPPVSPAGARPDDRGQRAASSEPIESIEDLRSCSRHHRATGLAAACSLSIEGIDTAETGALRADEGGHRSACRRHAATIPGRQVCLILASAWARASGA